MESLGLVGPPRPEYQPCGMLTIFEAYHLVGNLLYPDEWNYREFGVGLQFQKKYFEYQIKQIMASGRRFHEESKQSGNEKDDFIPDYEGQLVEPWYHDISAYQYIESLEKLDTETYVSVDGMAAIVPDGDVIHLKRHQATMSYLRDLLSDSLWAGLMSTKVGGLNIEPNATQQTSNDLPTLPSRVWRTDNANDVMLSGKIEVNLEGELRECWVMVSENDLEERLARESRIEGSPSKMPKEEKSPQEVFSDGAIKDEALVDEWSIPKRDVGDPKPGTVRGWKQDHDTVEQCLRVLKNVGGVNAAAKRASVSGERSWRAIKRGYYRYNKYLREQKGQE
jgi:hypothetical protein